MRCPAEETPRFVRQPDLSLSAALIYGPDPILASENKRLLLEQAAGENAGDDMFVVTLDPSQAQRSGESVRSALTSCGLLPGRRVALLEPATNLHANSVAYALEDADPEDAFLIVVAGDLKPQSPLRKLFESSKRAIALPSEAKPPAPHEIRQRFEDRNLPPPSRNAVERLALLAGEMTWGEFEALFAKLELYLRGQTGEATVGDVDACAPVDRTVQIDELVDAVASGNRAEVARLVRALEALGTQPVSIAIPATLQFQNMYRAVGLSRGPRDVRSQLFRLPMHPLRRQALLDHCERWNAGMLEAALRELHGADLALRSRNALAPYAVLERALMRIAGMARRRPRQR